ncbi:cysteine-rich CWC family protein [Azotobacter beijerinckii]|uniref:cysteine-rich CWC family protein n=1 Tax=Azotobacter beijerinckii TaxID=170623 RepID=UPI002954ECD3|nr:cysteine-rich CWC family protein [Azotobacter beijerinckii]MDV7212250.1 cysteine-rich CWC family protein [Azotobacter beijerinckii]
MSLNTDPTRCPLCGDGNACGLASPSRSAECWCFSKPANPDALKCLPADLCNQACLCPRCLQQLHDETTPDAP